MENFVIDGNFVLDEKFRTWWKILYLTEIFVHQINTTKLLQSSNIISLKY